VALALQPPHISIYHLTIAQHLLQEFPPAIPEDDTAYAMLDQITEMTGSAACSVMRCRFTAGAPVFSQPQLLAVW
jgi:oxygen-independent coproporphyrinogen-3 oxidase